MTYKEFKKWVKRHKEYENGDFCGAFRNCICREIIEHINKHPFWRREEIWREKYENMIVESVVAPTEYDDCARR